MRKIYSFLVFFIPILVVCAQTNPYLQGDQCVTDISINTATVSIFTSDGKIYTWGDNQFGQIGDGTTNPYHAPDYYLRPETPEFVSISHGKISSSGLTADGKIYTWGTNLTGVLGDGTTTDNFIPTQVGTDADWIKVVNTWVNNIALKSDGTLWGWGNNGNCALIPTEGGLDNYYPNPIQLSPDNDWVDIGAGAGRTFAIKSNGTLWVRGRNNGGSLGLPNMNEMQCAGVLTQIGTDTDWKKVVPANMVEYSLALKTDNTLWWWGSYNHLYPDTPQAPTQIGTDTWNEVAAGRWISVGIKSDGTLWNWGVGCYLDSTLTSMMPPDAPLESPVQVDTRNDWVKVAAGPCTAYALRADNTVWAFGRTFGMGFDDFLYGNENVVSSATPVLVFQCANASVSEHELSNLILYPNPTTDKIFWAQNIVIEKATVYDMNGKQVLSENITGNSIDVSHLANGTYLIKLESQDKLMYNSKFVKN